MVDLEETLWDMNRHTQAKHDILDRYLKAWFPILFSRERKLVYIDGFAGPGKYKGGEIGSPLIAIKVATEHKLKDRFGKIIFTFIEKRPDRFEHLEKTISTLGALPSTINIEKYNLDFNDFLATLLDTLERKGASLAPTFVFVDPFGYSDLRLDLLARVLKCDKCELLITYMVGFLDRFLFDEKHHDSICKVLGIREESLDKIIALSTKEEREETWLRLLKEKLIELSKTDLYQLSFVMRGEHNTTLYYLVFFTKSVVGMKAMKEAMWNVGRTGEYTFSDFNFEQSSLIDYSKGLWIKQAADLVYNEYKGKTITLTQLETWVILYTRFIFRKEILVALEKEDKIQYEGIRQKSFTYPDKRGRIIFQ
jgi:three-Cys-motif partner protein